MRHAFPGSRNGSIAVSLKRSDGGYLLRIEDDGIGMPEGVALDIDQSLGLKLVNNLVHQIKGSIALERNSGTRYSISFNNP